MAVRLPIYLSEQGMRQIIAPLRAKSGQPWADLGDFKAILYPFVEGRDGYAAVLSPGQWGEMGAALRKLHTLVLPRELRECIPQERFSAQWRDSVRKQVDDIQRRSFADPARVELAGFVQARQEQILDLVERAEGLGRGLQAQPRENVLCHSDLHAGNVLIAGGGALYLVDWDNPIYAPKERDLMFIGGAQGFAGRSPQEEEALFYQGYGETQVETKALAYYRCERIVEDLAIFCEQIFSTDEGGEDRQQALRYFKSNFAPGGTIEIAYRSVERAG
jgi:spectinomycin phosphotransferase